MVAFINIMPNPNVTIMMGLKIMVNNGLIKILITVSAAANFKKETKSWLT